MKILVTGATGYIGGRLIPRLISAGHDVKILVRDDKRVAGRAWEDQVTIVKGDVLNKESLAPALQDVDVAYYLIHSMTEGAGFGDRERRGAENFVLCGKENKNLSHVIYLGGLMPSSNPSHLSKHLKSRDEVGRILRKSLPTTEFRAGPIIGSGSASFEMVRYLTERLPIMVAPKWIMNEIQPIAVRDMLSYLVEALKSPPLGVVNVGTDAMKFKEMMLIFAEVRGLKRTIFPVPVLAPTLAALWIGLVTPITNRLAVPIVQSMIRSLTGDTTKAQEAFPEIKPADYKLAVKRALDVIDKGFIETHWSGAVGGKCDYRPYEVTDREGVIQEKRSLPISASSKKVFQTFTSVGGAKGWLTWKWAWHLRGIFDRLIGGPGLRRGRRHPEELLVGEALDFWRVEEVVQNRLLRLRAEMKVPGKAWLQWEVRHEKKGSRLIQTAIFVPKGFWGNAYWYVLYPIHRLIFSDMAKALAQEAETNMRFK
ncbi:MAG: SDR family oxidoreductase [Verrucomicrobiota bacterium]